MLRRPQFWYWRRLGTGEVPGNFLPFLTQTIGDNMPGWLKGDVLIHSVDPTNGNPANGEANVAWTAPQAATINISGDIWYAQYSDQRSDDYYLFLNGTQLASGTVNYMNSNRNNSSFFGASGLSVNAGDVVEFVIQRSLGQPYGCAAGLNLTITESGSEDSIHSR